MAGFQRKKFSSGEGLCGGKNELAPTTGKKLKLEGGAKKFKLEALFGRFRLKRKKMRWPGDDGEATGEDEVG